jgi:hypothetical protein
VREGYSPREHPLRDCVGLRGEGEASSARAGSAHGGRQRVTSRNGGGGGRFLGFEASLPRGLLQPHRCAPHTSPTQALSTAPTAAAYSRGRPPPFAILQGAPSSLRASLSLASSSDGSVPPPPAVPQGLHAGGDGLQRGEDEACAMDSKLGREGRKV